MHHHYNDIRSRISEPPLWWDEHAVPRYSPFSPDQTADIYADECALVDIACQYCGTRFLVAFSSSQSDRVWQKVFNKLDHEPPSLADCIRNGSLHYGDPPNVACCPAGPTMNCEDLRVVEYWKKSDGGFDMVRVPDLEILLADHPDFATSREEREK